MPNFIKNSSTDFHELMYSGNRFLDGGTDRVDEAHRRFLHLNVTKCVIGKKGDGRIEKSGFSFENFVQLRKFLYCMRNSSTRNYLVSLLVY